MPTDKWDMTSRARSIVQPVAGEGFIARFRRAIAEADPQCHCEETAEAVLERISLENTAMALDEARQMLRAVITAADMLGELDDISADEPDRTAFLEIAHLFEDIAEFALSGAGAARRIAQRNDIA